MNLAALSTLHQLLVGNLLRIQGAWPQAIEGQGNHPLFWGVGARSKRGPQGWDPISVQEPKQDVWYQGLDGLSGESLS
jgi:hypothetical protein